MASRVHRALCVYWHRHLGFLIFGFLAQLLDFLARSSFSSAGFIFVTLGVKKTKRLMRFLRDKRPNIYLILKWDSNSHWRMTCEERKVSWEHPNGMMLSEHRWKLSVLMAASICDQSGYMQHCKYGGTSRVERPKDYTIWKPIAFSGKNLPQKYETLENCTRVTSRA